MKIKNYILGCIGAVGWFFCIPTMLIGPFFIVCAIDFANIATTIFLLTFLIAATALLYYFWIASLVSLFRSVACSKSKNSGRLLIISGLYIGIASIATQGVFGLIGPALLFITGQLSDTPSDSLSPIEKPTNVEKNANQDGV